MADKCQRCGKTHDGITSENARALRALHRMFNIAKNAHLSKAVESNRDEDELLALVINVESAEMLALLDTIAWAHANPMQVEMLLIEIGEAMSEDTRENSAIMNEIYNKHRERNAQRG